MNKLLSSNFSRLQKSKIFWLGMAFMFLAGTALVLKQYKQVVMYGYPVKLESTFFSYTLLILVVSAIFCPLFLGVEYSDGTLRNKIIVGHKRSNIYFSNLIVNIVASLLFCLSYILSNVIIGIPLIGFKKAGIETILLVLGGSFFTVITLCSLFTMISLLIQNKALAPVICIVGIFLMIGITSEVKRMLEEPEYYYDDARNSNYLEKDEREKYEFFYNLTPTGQEMQYSGMKTKNITDMCLYSAGIIIITTGIGNFLFNRKDIK